MNPVVSLVLALCVGYATAGDVEDLVTMAQAKEDRYTAGSPYSNQITQSYINKGAFVMELVPIMADKTVIHTLVRVNWRTVKGTEHVLELVKMKWPRRTQASIEVAKQSIQPVLDDIITAKKMSVTYWKALTTIKVVYTLTEQGIKIERGREIPIFN